MKTFSDETRHKMSEAARKRCQSAEWLASQIARGTQLDEKQVRLLYESGKTQSEIAALLGVSQKVIFNFMRRHGIKSRVAAKRNQLRENNSSWAGGIRQEKGYVLLYRPEHPNAKPNGYVREHDLVASEMIGRPLRWYGATDSRSEVVHHINGDKTDNTPQNLLVLSPKEHRRIHSAVRKDQIDDVLLGKIRTLETENKALWEEIHGKGTARWASEIEPFPIRVTEYHFGRADDE